jgi:Esterase-like activity of phytase
MNTQNRLSSKGGVRFAGTLRVCQRTAGVLTVLAFAQGVAMAAVFTVNNNPSQFSLYRDPITKNEINLGGFSGLYPVPGDTTGKLIYTVTDRGPNGDHPDNDKGKVFLRPDYSPSIVTVRLNGAVGVAGNATILNVMPLRKPNGDPVNGLPNPCLADSEDAYDIFLNPVPSDSDGLDVEGLSMDASGNFWVSDEYRPSVAMVSPEGVVLMRLVPEGTLCGDEQIPTMDILPGVYAKRRANRGFEGVAVTPNGLVYTVIQRPLQNPNKATGDASRNIRLVEINLAALMGESGGAPIRQFIYQTEVEANGSKQSSVYASDLFALSNDVILVPERSTDKIFAIDISEATDITDLEDSDGNLVADSTRTIESLSPDELADFGITPVAKALVLDSMTALDPALEKAEGLAVVNGRIVLCQDNDFNFDSIDALTSPASVILLNPPNPPKIITTPFPSF